MQNKGKRYRFIEEESKENKIEKAIIVTILIIIAAGIVSIFLFFEIFGFQASETDGEVSSEPMTMGVVFITEPVETYPTYFTLPINDDFIKPTSGITERHSQKSTQKPTQRPIIKPTEPPEEKMWLLDIDNPDYDYSPQAINLTDEDRELIAKVVMREFGDGGYIACCLQAQAYRDAMVLSQASAEYTYHYFQYDAYSLTETPNQDCYDAVDFVFAGNMAVQHRILVMYAPEYSTSSWHESQIFVVEYDGVRFFDMR